MYGAILYVEWFIEIAVTTGAGTGNFMDAPTINYRVNKVIVTAY